VLTPKIGVDLDVAQWSVPPVFGWLASLGQLQPREMLRTLNVGIGMTLLVEPEHVASVLEALIASGTSRSTRVLRACQHFSPHTTHPTTQAKTHA
jgi:phosphoribosylformylglycinamidine cyclo-ligase